MEDTFRDSNFGVLKCYKLIFSSEYKTNNIGFWIFLFFVIFHIPIYLHCFIKGNNFFFPLNFRNNKKNTKNKKKNIKQKPKQIKNEIKLYKINI